MKTPKSQHTNTLTGNSIFYQGSRILHIHGTLLPVSSPPLKQHSCPEGRNVVSSSGSHLCIPSLCRHTQLCSESFLLRRRHRALRSLLPVCVCALPRYDFAPAGVCRMGVCSERQLLSGGEPRQPSSFKLQTSSESLDPLPSLLLPPSCSPKHAAY